MKKNIYVIFIFFVIKVFNDICLFGLFLRFNVNIICYSFFIEYILIKRYLILLNGFFKYLVGIVFV